MRAVVLINVNNLLNLSISILAAKLSFFSVIAEFTIAFRSGSTFTFVSFVTGHSANGSERNCGPHCHTLTSSNSHGFLPRVTQSEIFNFPGTQYHSL